MTLRTKIIAAVAAGLAVLGLWGGVAYAHAHESLNDCSRSGALLSGPPPKVPGLRSRAEARPGFPDWWFCVHRFNED